MPGVYDGVHRVTSFSRSLRRWTHIQFLVIALLAGLPLSAGAVAVGARRANQHGGFNYRGAPVPGLLSTPSLAVAGSGYETVAHKLTATAALAEVHFRPNALD